MPLKGELFLPMLAVVMVSWYFEMSDLNTFLPVWAERGGKLLEMCNATDFRLLPLLQAWHCSLNLFTCFESCTQCNLEFCFPYCNSTWRVSSLYLSGPLHCPVLNWPGCCAFFVVCSPQESSELELPFASSELEVFCWNVFGLLKRLSMFPSCCSKGVWSFRKNLWKL